VVGIAVVGIAVVGIAVVGIAVVGIAVVGIAVVGIPPAEPTGRSCSRDRRTAVGSSPTDLPADSPDCWQN